MAEDGYHGDGFIDSVRRLARSALGLLHTRLELFAVEMEEEKLRVVDMLVWLGIAIALGAAGILVSIGVLALFLWQAAGYAGLIALAAVTLAASVGLLVAIRHRLRHGRGPFGATLGEFRKDVAGLRGET
ncbi:MAG: phage holin family protein [Opitutaceae bacterium]|nr:phage holin family protein [Opitutaceae bacterium]